MPIVGFALTSINAQSKGLDVRGDIAVNSTPVIEDIKRKDMEVLGIGEVLGIQFTYTTKYEPQIGEISIGGEVLYQTTDADKILEMWKQKKIESKIATEVLNTILKKCITKSVVMSDDLRLPPPLTFPIVQTGTPQQVADQKQKKHAKSK